MEAQVLKIKEALDLEKSEKKQLLADIQDLDNENAELTLRNQQSLLLIERLKTGLSQTYLLIGGSLVFIGLSYSLIEQENLNGAFEDMTEQVSQQKLSIKALQAEKQKIQEEKAKLSAELQEITLQISAVSEKEKGLKESLQKYGNFLFPFFFFLGLGGKKTHEPSRSKFRETPNFWRAGGH